jgi:hypothetical protein
MCLPHEHLSSLCRSGSVILEMVTKCRVYAQSASMKYTAKMEIPDVYTVLAYTGAPADVFIYAERSQSWHAQGPKNYSGARYHRDIPK